jgi:hypothetical protein
VIVGDVEQVPASATGTQSGKLTDLYYASVDGDMFPDMYYGRLSAISEAQLTAMVNKILYYEKFQFADAQYLNNATLIAGADATWNPAIAQPTIKYATANHFNQTKAGIVFTSTALPPIQIIQWSLRAIQAATTHNALQ